mgnify:CR=1 FL=1
MIKKMNKNNSKKQRRTHKTEIIITYTKINPNGLSKNKAKNIVEKSKFLYFFLEPTYNI